MSLNLKVYYGDTTYHELRKACEKKISNAKINIINERFSICNCRPASKEMAELAVSTYKNIKNRFSIESRCDEEYLMYLFNSNVDEIVYVENLIIIYSSLDSNFEATVANAIGTIINKDLFYESVPHALKELRAAVSKNTDDKDFLEILQDDSNLFGTFFSMAYASSAISGNLAKWVNQFTHIKMPAISPLESEFVFTDFLDMYFSIILKTPNSEFLTTQLWNCLPEIKEFLGQEIVSGELTTNS